MNIVVHRRIFYIISGTLAVMSLAALAVFGLRLGIDFTGGSILEIEFRDTRPEVEELAKTFETFNLGEVRLQPTGEHGILVRIRHIDEPTHQAILSALGGGVAGKPASSIVERRFDTIGPSISLELRRKSLMAIGLVIFLIVSYIALAFRKVSADGSSRFAGSSRVSKPLPSWKYGVTTVVALVHDVLIPAGFFAVAGRFFGFEVDTLFVTAILTILGFSVHDTIVVFDRIRENLKNAAGRSDFAALVNQSVNATFTRSINTSLTVVLAIGAVLAFGGASTAIFALTLIIGIIFGTYSSIFIASPLLVSWHNWNAKIKNQKSK